MILPLGPQNVFVMNQGIRRQYHLMIASLCALSDIVLICAGIFGGSALLTRSPLLLALVTRGGVSAVVRVGRVPFRLQPATGAGRGAGAGAEPLAHRGHHAGGHRLNPHVYLDTFVVLGSLGGQLTADVRSWFALGAVSASAVWFFGLALLASWLAPWLNTQRAQRIINALVGLVMWGIALQLAWQGQIYKNLSLIRIQNAARYATFDAGIRRFSQGKAGDQRQPVIKETL